MNRPKYEDYEFPNNETVLESLMEYSHDLDEYADQLEKQILARDEIIIEKNKNIKLHSKALSLACEILENYDEIISGLRYTRLEWKVHLLKKGGKKWNVRVRKIMK